MNLYFLYISDKPNQFYVNFVIEEEYNDGLLQAYSADWEFYKQRIAMAVTYRPYADTIPSGLARPVIQTIAFEYVYNQLYVLL